MAIELKFNAEKTKIGNSYFVLVPMDIAGLLEDKEYTFIIKEAN